MPKLFLIDQSLKDESGHHFDYSKCVADESAASGFQVIIGTHARYQPQNGSFENATVRPVFRNTTYSELSTLPGLRKITRSKLPLPGYQAKKRSRFFPGNWRVGRANSRREQYMDHFQRDCRALFEGFNFSKNDHVFFITLSELELTGLTRFLCQNSKTLPATWHLQFHFDLYLGRPAEFESQRIASGYAVDSFQRNACDLQNHRVHYYTTSIPLAEQYNQIPGINFQPLAYPVNPGLNTSARNQNCPLRVTCAGGFRREKGVKDFLAPLVRDVSLHGRLKSQVNFWIQGKPHRTLTRLKKDFAEIVHHLPHPLPENEYVNMIQHSDIGLLFYDSRTYYSRRAGILGEFLSCGKPVIVPSGCWLGEQIAEVNYQYAERLFKLSQPSSPNFTIQQKSPLSSALRPDCIKFDAAHPVNMQWEPKNCKSLIILRLKWAQQNMKGRFCEISMGPPSTKQPRQVKIVGTRHDRSEVYVVFEKTDNQPIIELKICNAYDNRVLELEQLLIRQIMTDDHSILPTGVVGCSVAGPEQLLPAIEQITRHYLHYKNSSEKFSHLWNLNHLPSKTLSQLLATGRTAFAA